MGSGAAQLQALEPLLKLAVVFVDVARIGVVAAMVDSGAMVSVVRKDVVLKLLREENRMGGFIVGFDKKQVEVLWRNKADGALWVPGGRSASC